MYVKNLSFKYPKCKELVLNNINLTLKQDRLNVLVGLNGSGKTTLFDCITDVLKPETGEIVLPPVNEILYLTQTIFFSPVIRGRDFAKFIFRLDNRQVQNDIDYYLDGLSDSEKKQLKKLWGSTIGKMSVGERKWLFVTMLSQIERRLYMFDEPTSGVDPSARLKILKRIDGLIAKGKTCIISTHQLQDLMHIDSHIIMLHEGIIKYEGDFKEWLGMYGTTNPDVAFDMCIS
ncbi:AAA family ATPase [Bacillus wiedmannii]|uniref:ABC transporter n=1 Tax=Bacillus wiedmannii TaxID=1890302 RepID=A0A2A7BUJ3_9BACI|nr:AAA family ATPase [Bacillus wiedmannii]KMP77628.1 ABC transporter [Bacillus cereus]MBG9855629.1 ABC transporter [Bacillus wiedmannii]MCQ6544438.1 ATP-binding cassette domain-containing protein [Bacillus wiedmannii]MCQ6573878.1 ATP-binding cassette domain-containing protein [Bacillus wiedmannii]MCU5574610.1 ATP-binding cassette domain-containing protein [Bacillus wiedmannii]